MGDEDDSPGTNDAPLSRHQVGAMSGNVHAAAPKTERAVTHDADQLPAARARWNTASRDHQHRQRRHCGRRIPPGTKGWQGPAATNAWWAQRPEWQRLQTARDRATSIAAEHEWIADRGAPVRQPATTSRHVIGTTSGVLVEEDSA